ncbi:alpha/beta fold hydrolase (plasmid) [Phyllobacteriaceae bacterium JZ32]
MRIVVRLLGYPRLEIDGRAVDFRLQKGLALIAFLAEARAPVTREALSALLWPDLEAEAARARLRRTLHQLRGAVGQDIVSADRISVRLDPAPGISIDSAAFEAACNRNQFADAVRLYESDFLAGLSLAGCEEFDDWAFFRREALRSRFVQALERLVEQGFAAGDARASLPPALRLVGLDPFSEVAHRHVMRAHILIGDRAAAERQYETCRRLLADELGVSVDPETTAVLATAEKIHIPQTQYAARNDIHLAYQTVGTGALDIVWMPGFVSHVERAWDEPHARQFLMKLSSLGRLVFFDRRGVGLSDRIGSPPTIEATAEDLLTVLDAIKSRRALLIGASEGGPACIRFAAGWPERLAGLVLYGSLARGSWSKDYPFVLNRAQYDVWLKQLVSQWGGPMEIETFAPGLAEDPQARSWWAGLLRAASSPGAIKGVLEALRDTDVRTLLPSIRVPTLVLHRRGDRAVRFEAGRHLAEAIPGARFVELEGDDHWAWAGDQDTLIQKIRMFAARL